MLSPAWPIDYSQIFMKKGPSNLFNHQVTKSAQAQPMAQKAQTISGIMQAGHPDPRLNPSIPSTRCAHVHVSDTVFWVEGYKHTH